MPKIIIAGTPGLDGEYELDMTFTHRDFHTIKQVAGLRANEVMDALEQGDLDIIVAMAAIALRRAGTPHAVDQLWDSAAGAITLDVTDMEEAEAETPPVPEDAQKTDDAKPSSGLSTNGATDASPETSNPDSSGIPRLGNTSDLLTSTN